MKKILCVLLSFIFVFGSAFSAAAVGDDDSASAPDYPIVIVRGMDFSGLYLNYGEENQTPCIATPDKNVILSAVAANVKSLLTSKSLDVDSILNVVDGMLGSMACDKNGDSLYNVGLETYTLSVANYPNLLRQITATSTAEIGIVANAIDYYGADNVYYFTYDWRLDPLDICDKLNNMIEQAKADHNTDKVDLICCSMGGIMTDAYIYKYGSASLNKCVFNSSTFCGAYVSDDLFRGKVLITDDMLYNFVSDKIDSEFFVKVLKVLGLFKFAEKIAMQIVDKYKDYIYDNLLRDCFATMPSLWALVQPEHYEDCINYMFPTDELKAEYAGLIARADRLHEMTLQMDDVIRSLPENGVKTAVVASYDTQQIPVYESAQLQCDGTLDTAPMLGKATVSKMRDTLGDDYVPDDPSRLSPDRCIDLSNVLLPEYTWAVKGSPHVSGSHNTDMGEFIFWILTYDGQPTVHTNPDYPQFMVSNGKEEISKF